MSQYTEFFLGSNSKVVELETLEIAHPAFSKTYWVVRNARMGVTAVLENGVPQRFDFYPVRVNSTGQTDDLDQGFDIIIGDVGKVLPLELDNIAAVNGFDIYPTVRYRTWRSDYLTQALVGPIDLQVKGLITSAEGCSFRAQAPQLNSNKTGEVYRLARFPMLRGLL